MKIEVYDTTLRDGAQGPGVKFSSQDQLLVVQELDALGVRYIEGGQPGSNPKAAELFEQTKDADLKYAEMVAFGSTRHPRIAPEDDPNLRALLDAGTRTVTIFAKSSPLHAKEILRVSLDENLQLVRDSIGYLRAQGREVILDAEHFFDGYDEDDAYALAVLSSAVEAGATHVVLCDTNGGHLPHQVDASTRVVVDRFPKTIVGIHTHNDAGCGVANAIAAVHAGASQVQGTINGYGERTGNANLCSVVPSLQLKMGVEVLSPAQLERLTHVSHVIAELANMVPRDRSPYVGRDAFTHKGGMHADAVRKVKASYEHIDPAVVGNKTHVAVSEVSGRSSLLQKAAEFGIELDRDHPHTKAILEQVKDLENKGYEFEGADASLELVMRKVIGDYRAMFTPEAYHVSVNHMSALESLLSEATVKLRLPEGTHVHTVSEGDGPVDALNNALRKALEAHYPQLESVKLEDYKVRILDGKLATRAKTRVLIESRDEQQSWNTVGVSENVITASYYALIDSIEYKLMQAHTTVDSAVPTTA